MSVKNIGWGLPAELTQAVLRKIDFSDLLSVRRVCTYLAVQGADRFLWTSLCERHYVQLQSDESPFLTFLRYRGIRRGEFQRPFGDKKYQECSVLKRDYMIVENSLFKKTRTERGFQRIECDGAVQKMHQFSEEFFIATSNDCFAIYQNRKEYYQAVFTFPEKPEAACFDGEAVYISTHGQIRSIPYSWKEGCMVFGEPTVIPVPFTKVVSMRVLGDYLCILEDERYTVLNTHKNFELVGHLCTVGEKLVYLHGHFYDGANYNRWEKRPETMGFDLTSQREFYRMKKDGFYLFTEPRDEYRDTLRKLEIRDATKTDFPIIHVLEFDTLRGGRLWDVCLYENYLVVATKDFLTFFQKGSFKLVTRIPFPASIHSLHVVADALVIEAMNGKIYSTDFLP